VRQNNSGISQKAVQNILLAVIVLLGILIRSQSTCWNSLEMDEAQQLNFLSETDFLRLIQAIAGDSNPPLIHLIYWPLVQLFNSNIFPEKLLAFLISSLLPLLAFFILRPSLGPFVGIYASALLALCPDIVRFGELIRCYGLLHISSLLLTVLLFDLQKRRRGKFIQYVITLTASMYLHLFFATIAIGHALRIGCLLRVKPDGMRFAITWFKACLLSGSLFLPWLFVVVWQLQHPLQPWNDGIYPLVTVLLKTPFYFFVVLLAVPVCLNFFFRDRPNRALILVWYQIFSGALAGAILLHLLSMPYRERYLSIITPTAMVLVALIAREIAVSPVTNPRKRVVFFLAALVPILGLTAVWLPELLYLNKIPESQSFMVAQEVSSKIHKDKDLIVVSYEAFCPEFARAFDNDVQIVSFPDVEKVHVIHFEGINQRIRDDKRLDKLCNLIDKTLELKGNVWLLSIPVEEKFPKTFDKKLRYVGMEYLRIRQIKDYLLQHSQQKESTVYPAREADFEVSRFAAVPTD
jgi:uncharacterized membrane protein